MTYSIVARDRDTGQLGVAVQSHYFCTGGAVTWAEAGVGAVATQSIVDVGYGPRGIDAMRAGAPADTVLKELVAADPMAAVRQVAMVDVTGAVATHTGPVCVAHAGHRVGDGVSVQANMMLRATVPDAMLEAYTTAHGDLAARLLAALDAAEAEGGDIRGRQSAAMLIVDGKQTDRPWDARIVDVRVDDHEEPLGELRRLVDYNRAFALIAGVFFGGVLFAQIDDPNGPEVEGALHDLQQAQETITGNLEPTFWQAVILGKAGRLDEARAKLATATATNSNWPAFLQRLPAVGALPPDSPLLQDLTPTV
jgi:uncharacterized Ntn-hydrolase superfamily protein